MARPIIKTPVDIEKLLVWAYRDELAKLHTSCAEGIWDHIEDASTLGIVTTTGEGCAQRYDFGLPDDDAIAIEKAVAQLGDTIIDWEQSRDAILAEVAPLFAKRDVLMVRPFKTAALVTMHAKMNTRPDWHEETPRPRPVMAKSGPAGRAMLVGSCEGKDRYSFGAHCPLRWEPSPVTIAIARGDYAAWHHGLVLLAETLRLDRHEALPPAAPALPWLDGPEPKRRVFLVGERAAGVKPLPLKPSRPLTASPLRRNRKVKEKPA